MLERKQHIRRLPVVNYPSYALSGTDELAISIPLFFSEKDTTFEDFDTDRFQNIHCKGAIWAALALLHNTDLPEKGVPVFFHIEDKALAFAKPMFDAFGVPEEFIKVITVPEGEPLPDDMNKAHFGKKYIGLLDDSLSDADVLMIFDSDAFILVDDAPLPFYDKLTSPLLKSRPSMTYFHYSNLEYEWWVHVLNMATGRPAHTEGKLNVLEQEAYARLGFSRDLERDLEPDAKVWRVWCDNYMVTFPKDHPVRQYTIDNIHTCYCSPYIHSVWSEYNEPFIQLKDILGIPVYNWESTFIDKTKEDGFDCMMHCRTDKGESVSRVDEFYDDFWHHLTLNIPRLQTKAGPIDRTHRGTDDRNLLGGPGKPGKINGYDVKYKPDASVDATYHCIAIPHLPTFKKHSSNTHALNVVSVCEALHHSGQRVYHYGHPDSVVDCTEHIPVQSRELFEALYGKLGDLGSEKYTSQDAVYTEFSVTCIRELKNRVHAGDFVILFWGVGHFLIHQELKKMPVHVLGPVFERS